MTKKRKWAVITVGVVLFIITIAPAISKASGILKSKSNISNNRLLVISSTITQPAAPDGGHLLLLDTETGEIWDYSYKSLTGNALPKYVSTMQSPGDPVLLEQKYR